MNKEKNKTVYIGDLEFFSIVSQKIVMNDYPEFLEKDLLNIYQTQEIHEGNIKSLFIYLDTLQNNRLPYYQRFVEFILANCDEMSSAQIIDNLIAKDKYLYDVISKHFYSEQSNREAA